MNKKKMIALSLALVLVMAFSACAGGGQTPAPAAPNPPAQQPAPAAPADSAPPAANLPPIKLGNIQDMTGTASESGQANAWGVEYAVKEINAAGGINGRQIELITLDCKNDAEEALNAYRKLVDEHQIDALIGPPLSNSALTWVDLVTEDEIPCVGHFMDERCTTSPDTGEVYPYMFLAEPGCRQQAFSLAEFALSELGLKSFALVYNSQNAFAITQAKPFIEYVTTKGGQVLVEETFTWADTDYGAQCIKVANAKPDAMVITDYAAQAMLLIQQLRDAGYEGVILGANTVGPPLQNMYEGDLKDVYFLQNVDAYSTGTECYDLLQEYKKAFNKNYPVANACFGYDAVMVMADAMRRAKDPTDGVEVRGLLESVKDVPTSSGPISISATTHRPVGMGMYIGEYSKSDRTKVDIVKFIKVAEDAV